MTQATGERKPFRRIYRLTKRSEFEKCQAAGRRYHSGKFILVHLPVPDAKARLGVAVTRNTGGAVVRNRWKRLIRECFRLGRDKLTQGGDHVVIVRRSVHESPDASARAELRTLFSRIR